MKLAVQQEIKINPDNLTAEQLALVSKVKDGIELQRIASVMQYGLASQEKMASFSDRALRTMTGKDMGAIGDLLQEIVTYLGNFESEEKKGLFGKTKRVQLSLKELQDKYIRIEKNIEAIKDNLTGQRIQLLQDMHILDDLSELNDTHICELEIYLYAGKIRAEEERSGRLAELKQKAEKSGDIRDVQGYQDAEELCNVFERKLLDLNITRTAALQLGLQIRLLQRSQAAMASKIDATITNVIPIWKSRMAVLLGLESLNKAMGMQAAVDLYTNEMMQETSSRIKDSALKAKEQSEKTTINLETLKKTNEDLVSTFADVMKMQADGQEKREEVERELSVMNADIKTKLHQI